jgi:hypothetical protein
MTRKKKFVAFVRTRTFYTSAKNKFHFKNIPISDSETVPVKIKRGLRGYPAVRAVNNHLYLK